MKMTKLDWLIVTVASSIATGIVVLVDCLLVILIVPWVLIG